MTSKVWAGFIAAFFCVGCQQAGEERVVNSAPIPPMVESEATSMETPSAINIDGGQSPVRERNLEDYEGLMPRVDVIDSKQAQEQNLLRLNRNEIELIFGASRFVRQEFNAQVLQYRSPKCVADFYFYAAEDELTPMRYFEFRPFEASESAEDESPAPLCLASFFDGRNIPVQLLSAPPITDAEAETARE